MKAWAGVCVCAHVVGWALVVGSGCGTSASTANVEDTGGGASATDAAPDLADDRPIPPPGPPGCGFASAAFCETFEAPPHAVTRAGELDPLRWSGLRAHNGVGGPYGLAVGLAHIPRCRPGLTDTMVPPDRETVICDPMPTNGGHHLLTSTAAQNYGLNSYRIRQPFDFAGRTGTIRLDADLSGGILYGFQAISISEDPTPAPTFSFPERGSGPRNGVEIEFYGGWCNDPKSRTPVIYTFRDYIETADPQTQAPASYDCALPHATIAPDTFNRVEIRISQKRLEVWVSEPSPDGLTFSELRLLFAGAIDLPFTRGYVNISNRNHASMKYASVPSWPGRWDNIGFDGPVVAAADELSVPDSLTVAGDSPDGLTTGYVVPNEDEKAPVRLQLEGVTATGASSARLVLAASYPTFPWNDVVYPPTHLNLRYSVNDGPWHDRFLTAVEANAFLGNPATGGGGAGLVNQVIDLDVRELRDGTNTISFQGAGTWTGAYRIGIVAVDLLLTRP